MGLDDRDYIRGAHPPTCTCVVCNKGKHPRECPYCHSLRTYYNSHFRSWKCVACERSFGEGVPKSTSPSELRQVQSELKVTMTKLKDTPLAALWQKFKERLHR